MNKNTVQSVRNVNQKDKWAKETRNPEYMVRYTQNGAMVVRNDYPVKKSAFSILAWLKGK